MPFSKHCCEFYKKALNLQAKDIKFYIAKVKFPVTSYCL